LFIPPLRLSTTVSNTEAVRFRPDKSETRAVPPVSRVEPVADRAVVLQLGSRAISLARRDPSANPEQAERGAPKKESAVVGEESSDVASSEAQLSAEERRELQELRRRDREVRTHEQAHKTVAGQYGGAIHLEYESGPDGKRYAVSGSVSIDASPVAGDPEATLRKMEAVERAASAPANPSGTDRQVAARASQLAQRARAELAAERYGKAEPKPGAVPGSEAAAEAAREKRFAVVA
jgi:hypothetical protein